MDFNIDNQGEIKIGNEVLTLKQDYTKQLARSRIISVKEDWYYDNVGANIEEMFGSFMTKETEQQLKDRIISALTFDGLFDSRNLYVETHLDYETLSAKADIYFRNQRTNESDVMTINLDLFNGLLEE